MRTPNVVRSLVGRAVQARRIERDARAGLRRLGFDNAQISAMLLAADPTKPSAPTQITLGAAALQRGLMLREVLPPGPRKSNHLKGSLF